MKTKMIYTLMVIFSLGFFSCSTGDSVEDTEKLYIESPDGNDQNPTDERDKPKQ